MYLFLRGVFPPAVAKTTLLDICVLRSDSFVILDSVQETFVNITELNVQYSFSVPSLLLV